MADDINVGQITEVLNDKADDVSVVHKTGNETIGGSKKFTSAIQIGAISANDSHEEVRFADDSGQRVGVLRATNGASGGRRIEMFSAKADGTRSSGIAVSIDADGNEYHTAKTPDATSNTNHIATTAWVRDLFETLYPVGSLYITSTNATTCPLASIVKKSDGSNSTWALVSSGRALWTGTGSNGNTTIAAGLPNISGTFTVGATNNANDYTGGIFNTGGAFSSDLSTSNHSLGGGSVYTSNRRATFDASRSSSIYGNSTTVQPPAYVVNVWRRTA